MNLFVARQPIFDCERRVVAYELLFRSSTENRFDGTDTTSASLQTLDTTLLGFGLETLLGDSLGFFNASQKLLVGEHWRVLPPASTVIEVLEMVEPDADIVRACRTAREAGYRIALDDFVYRSEYEALLPHTDYVKVDWLATGRDERRAIVERMAPHGITMLAEKIETYDDFREAQADGYALFQGYFFCKPEVVSTTQVPASQASLARLIAEVNRPELDFDAVEAIIRQEVALSVKLLRYLRSAGLGWRHEVNSISQALRVLGTRESRRWASLVACAMMGNDKPAALVTTSLTRAQFCEEIGSRIPGINAQNDLFLVGLLSTLDALLDRPLPELLEKMPLAGEVTSALLDGEGPMGNCLAMVMAYDRGDWARVDTLIAETGIAPEVLPAAYRKSVAWVGGLMIDAPEAVEAVE